MNDVPRFGIDPVSISGKFDPPEERADLLVVGGGPAGLAAAIEAAEAGLSVILVDEHPVPPASMGLDVPYYFGGRMSAAVQNPERMVERIVAASPLIERAFEAGVDVRLGVSAWGAFVNGPGLAALPEPVVGLADGTRSWHCGFDRLIVAAGARDLVLFFEGADQAGVVGAQALAALLDVYGAFDGRRLVILGSDTLALETARRALDHGLEVAALIEVMAEPQGPADLVSGLAARGVPMLTSHVIRRAQNGVNGVEAAVVVPVHGGAEQVIACDTICLAIGLVPNIELLDVLGARLVLDPARGGYVPERGPDGATSLAQIFVAGDVAGLGGTTGACEAAGRRAAGAALASLRKHHRSAPATWQDPAVRDPLAYRLAWMTALLETGGLEVLACQCEEVTRADLLGVQPPRYLGERSPPMARRDLASLLADGPADPDHIKRLTRACMGPCQARRCREQVAMLLAIGGGVPIEAIKLAGYRAPVRPLSLAVLASMPEGEAMRLHWDTWFGIRPQWVPYDDVGTEREARWLGLDMHL